MSLGRKLAVVGVTASIAALVGAASQWRVGGGSAMAMIRLSWRTASVRLEECRTLTEEELEAIPAHMRRAQECTGDYLDYEIVLTIDDRVRVDTVSPSGLRRDRPIYVLHDEPVTPRDHRVTVRFSPIVPEAPGSAEALPVLDWSGTVSPEPGRVVLITTTDEGTALEARDREAR